MTLAYEADVAASFDRLVGRFKADVDADDFRLAGVLDALGPDRGRKLLDLGCGRGRFASRLTGAGFDVVGLDRSRGMLDRATGGGQFVCGSARALPFGDGRFDAAVAVEVLEHVEPGSIDAVLGEAARVLRPGGRLVIVDKNAGALDSTRPWLPAVAIKRLDEHRGRWMYPSGGAVRERWFHPRAFATRLSRRFEGVAVRNLIAPEEAARWVFRAVPASRRFALWTATAPGGAR